MRNARSECKIVTLALVGLCGSAQPTTQLVSELNETFSALLARYGSLAKVQFVNGNVGYPCWCDLVARALTESRRCGSPFNIRHFALLTEVGRNQEYCVDTIKCFGIDGIAESFDTLRPFYEQAKNFARNSQAIPKLLIYMVDCPSALIDACNHGEADEKTGVAVVTKFYPQILIHEALHLFGVNDGYDLNTKGQIDGCNGSCYMQYEPCDGSSLCAEHMEQFCKFINHVI
jgi:hypothetical protein